MLSRLKARARALKTETYALYIAARDPRTPWYAKGLVFLVVAYAVSPIDLIPDFIPVIGYLDDLLIVPAGIALALTMIPQQVIDEARAQARTAAPNLRFGFFGAVLIVLIWILAIIACAVIVAKLLRKRA
jgi:uncharacterized membrane protein YkvA (DUF1232 family)